MPANLNALIRYKTIDACLQNRRRKWTIDDLRDACAEALGEHRGRYGDVSERTLRDDLRVMRSDILGFSAPIEVEGGYYYYADPEYSIFQTLIPGMKLMTEVFEMLLEVRDRFDGDGFLEAMEQLARMTGGELPADLTDRIRETREKGTGALFMEEEVRLQKRESISGEPFNKGWKTFQKKTYQKFSIDRHPAFSWGRILELLH